MIALTQLRDHYRLHYQQAPKLISFAPGRINLLGEHVDYLGGEVLPAGIDRGIHVLGESAPGTLLLRSTASEESAEWTESILDEEPPSGWLAYVWGVLKELSGAGMPWVGGKILVAGDLPQGAGLSSSAALEVALIQYFTHCASFALPTKEIALMAQKVENLHVGTQCGIMDQFISVHAEKDRFLRLNCKTLEYDSIPFELHECQLVLANSMISHKLGADYNSIRMDLENAEKKLGRRLAELTPAELKSENKQLTESEARRAEYATSEMSRTPRFVDAARRGDAAEAGKLMCETHEGLSRLLGVSTQELDSLVEFASSVPGWYGGRMMGGGFGGCTLNLVRKEKIEDFYNQVPQMFKGRFGVAPELYRVRLERGAHVEKVV